MPTLLLVHAHPDDEAIATGGVMLRAHRDGHRIVLVTSTRGEEGEIHNMDEASTRPRLAEVRTEELRKAGQVLGVDRQEFLGYRDSGMAGTPANENPESFHQAPLEEAARRLAAILREERPAVVITYGPDGTYGHPDHIKAHHTTVAAVDLLATEGWQPGALYFNSIPRSAVEEMRRRFEELRPQGAAAEEADQGIRLEGVPDEQITTRVDVRDLVEEKMRAMSNHRSQVDPKGLFATMQGQILEAAFGWEAYIRDRGDGPNGVVTTLLPS